MKPGLFVPHPVSIPLANIQLAPYNPRHISPEKEAALRASVLKNGMVENLVVQKHSKEFDLNNVLIGGHQRLNAVKTICAEKGWTPPESLPCVVLDVSDSVAKQLNIALNNDVGEFDPYKLGELFSQIIPDMTIEDILATGFSHEQVMELTQLALSPDEQAGILEDGVGELSQFAKSITLSIEFDTVDERDATKDILKKLATEKKQKVGRIIMEALRTVTALGGSSKRTRGKKAEAE
jgi:ParB-like chromosome segregation protein Spo0J